MNLFILPVFIASVLITKEVLGDNLMLNHKNESELFEYVLLDGEDQCVRKCTDDSVPMTCRYHFTLEWYNVLSRACFNCPSNAQDCFRKDCVPVDGQRKSIIAVNRKIPGPSIQVCLGDEIIVDVENLIIGESTTIHWHGQHQRDYPYMDGVPMLTQCPIHSGSTFRYQFHAANPGTHFWHSHLGLQRGDGVFGSMIVRQPKEVTPHFDLYDYDLASHVITLIDWNHNVGIEKFMTHMHSGGNNKPPNLLVNGLGRFSYFDLSSNKTFFIPTARFFVEQGYRYRFRVINAGFLNCPIEISVDNHTLTVISSDGNDIKPIIAESLVTYAGERFDFIINANQPNDLYWMRFHGLMDCDERFTSAHQVAVLHYEGAEATKETYPEGNTTYLEKQNKEGRQINSLNRGTEANETYVSAPDFESLDDWDISLKKEADLKYYVAYDFYRINNPHFHKAPYYGYENVTDPKMQVLTPQLNFISMKFLSFPMLSQRYEIKEEMFCNETTVKNCQKDFCECPHVITAPLNHVVEIVLIDKGFAYDANHPFHLHGHSFRVVAMERMGKNVTVAQVYDKDKRGLIKRNLKNPPIKDTVNVPDGGYTVIRFHANNPGYWLFHCHIEFHAEVGMAIVFKVGEDSDMLPVPKDFPRCGDYIPEVGLPSCKSVSTIKRIENYLPKIFGKTCDGSHILPSAILTFVLTALVINFVI